MTRKDDQVIELRPEGLKVRIVFMPRNPVTICEVHSVKTGRFLSYGISRRRHGDRYDKVVGMKYALRSALSKFTDTAYFNLAASDPASLDTVRDAKTKIWEAFNRMYPPKANKSMAYAEESSVWTIEDFSKHIRRILAKARTGQL